MHEIHILWVLSNINPSPPTDHYIKIMTLVRCMSVFKSCSQDLKKHSKHLYLMCRQGQAEPIVDVQSI